MNTMEITCFVDSLEEYINKTKDQLEEGYSILDGTLYYGMIPVIQDNEFHSFEKTMRNYSLAYKLSDSCLGITLSFGQLKALAGK